MSIPKPGPISEVEGLNALRKVPDLTTDITDRVVGKCKIVGFVGRPAGAASGTGDNGWLMRCSCGDYEVIAYKKLFYYMGDRCKTELTCNFCMVTQCRVCGGQIRGDLRKRVCGPVCSGVLDDIYSMRSSLRRRPSRKACADEFKGIVKNPIRMLNLNPQRMVKIYQHMLDEDLTERDMSNSFTGRFHPILGIILRLGADIHARLEDYREVSRAELERIDKDAKRYS